MQNKFPLLGVVLVAGVLAAGCAGTQQKFGRGMSNTYEVVRLGEMQRSVEQTALFEPGSVTYASGFVRGFSRTMARTGIGVWEMVTAPIPNHKGGDYGPIWTSYLKPSPVYPDSFKPGLMNDPMFATDTAVGYSGGDVAPFIPGSRFRIYDN